MSSTPASKRNISPDVLKLDIDSCECELLAEYLARIRSKRLLPKLIQIELSAHLHPPLSFSERCHTPHRGVDQVKLMEQMIRKRGWYTRRWSTNAQVNGCSLQAATDLLAPYGYVLLQYDWPDGVFIQENFIYLFPSIASQTICTMARMGRIDAKDLQEVWNSLELCHIFLHMLLCAQQKAWSSFLNGCSPHTCIQRT